MFFLFKNMSGPLLALLLTTVASLTRADSTCVSEGAAIAHVALAIDTSSLREAGAGPAIAVQLRARADAALRRPTARPSGSRWSPVVAITVRPRPGRTIGYLATIAVQGAATTEPPRQLRCDLCTEGELIAQISAALEALAPSLCGGTRELPG